MASDTHRTIETVWRIESARLVAGLARIVRDIGLAEDLAQDALVAALEQWPSEGIPDTPGAWLMAIGKRRAVDLLRRRTLLERKHEELGRELEAQQAMDAPRPGAHPGGDGQPITSCRASAGTSSSGWVAWRRRAARLQPDRVNERGARTGALLICPLGRTVRMPGGDWRMNIGRYRATTSNGCNQKGAT